MNAADYTHLLVNNGKDPMCGERGGPGVKVSDPRVSESVTCPWCIDVFNSNALGVARRAGEAANREANLPARLWTPDLAAA